MWLIISLLPAIGFAQERQGSIKALTRSYQDSVLLRWAPADHITWKLGNDYGYTIERFTIGKDGQLDTTFQVNGVRLTKQPVKPWPLDAWETIVQADAYAAIAAQAVYGTSFQVASSTSNTAAMVNQMKESQNRFGFALFAADHSANTAQALGLRWVDKNVSLGEEYLYRVYLANNPAAYPVDTALALAKAQQPAALPAPVEVAGSFGDQVVTLSWNVFYFQHIYVSYTVEKSTDGVTFTKLDNLPLVRPDRRGEASQRMTLLDSLDQNGVKYYYRIRGLTPFAEVGPPSVVIEGKGVVSLRDIYPKVDTVFMQEDQSALIQWRFPEDKKQFVIGYEISRSAALEGPYVPLTKKLLGSDVSSFSDQEPHSTNYYRVRAMGPDSTFTSSLPAMLQLEDDTPPEAPIKLTGQIDQEGNVSIHWRPAQDTDIFGYRLYRANDSSEEFVMISKETIRDTMYVDRVSVATLSEEVYYRVVALDHRFNVSDYSEALKLTKPDVVPPVAAQFTTLRATDKGIEMSWLQSPSHDVAAYVLLRWHKSSRAFVILKQFDATDSAYYFLDEEVTPGDTYKYLLRTLDDDKLTAAFPSIAANAVDTGIRPSVVQIQSQVNREQRHIALRWSYSSQATLSGYQIYRAIGDGPLRSYQFISGQTQLIDTNLQINQQYRYAIQALFDDGSESTLSEEISVIY